MAGLTPSGFVPPTQDEIKQTIIDALKANVSASIDVNPKSRVGQFIKVVSSELSSIWTALSDVYMSQFPDTSYGVSLDNIGTITNTPRIFGSYGSVKLFFGAIDGITIPSESIVSHIDGYELITKQDVTVNQQSWLVTCEKTPTQGWFDASIYVNGLERLMWFSVYPTDSVIQIKNKIIAASRPAAIILELETVSVTGVFRGSAKLAQSHLFKIGDIVTIRNVAGVPDSGWQNYEGDWTVTGYESYTQFYFNKTTYSNPVEATGLIQARATLKNPYLTSSDFDVTGSLGENGSFHIHFLDDPAVTGWTYSLYTVNSNLYTEIEFVNTLVAASHKDPVDANGQELLDQDFLPNTVTKLLFVPRDVLSVTNIFAGDPAKARESDADYRVRLEGSKVNQNQSNIKSIVETLKNLQGVTFASIRENPLSVTSPEGLPPHSYEVFVDGGFNDEIAQAILNLKPAGVQIVSLAAGVLKRTGQATDWNGQSVSVDFTQFERVEIIVEVTGTKSQGFPADGVETIRQAIAEYINTRNIGEIFYSHKLYGPINDSVPGMIKTMTIKAAVLGQTLAENAIIDPTALKHVYCNANIPSNIVVTLT